RMAGADARDLWIAALDHTKPPRNLGRVDSNSCAFGPQHDVYFLKEEQNGINSVYRFDYETGNEKKLFSGGNGIFSVSREGGGAIGGVPRNTSALTVARPFAGGRDVPLCPACLARWSTDGRFLFLLYPRGTVTGRLHVLPVGADTAVPKIFASGPKSEE